jgi:hypothetical protein
LAHNKEFFQRLKNTSAYYNPHEWEREYQLQKKGQKFMRQVNYVRPKGFADPYGLDDAANLEKITSVSGSMETREPAASHVSRVRNIKADNAEAMRKSDDTMRTGKSPVFRKDKHSSSLPSIHHGHDGNVRNKSATLFGATANRESVSANSNGNYDEGEFDDYEEINSETPKQQLQHSDSPESRIELCSIRRSMRVVDFLTAADLAEFPPEDLMDHISPRQAHGVGSEAPVIVVDMDVKCFLVNNVDLVISATTCQGQPIFVDAEAEAPVSELCMLKGIPFKGQGIDPDHHSIEQDMLFIESLEGLARDIATTVEIKVEDEIPRLVLNIFDKKPFSGEEDDEYYDAEFDPFDSKFGPVELTSEDVETLLLDPIVVEKEMPIKVKFIVQHQVPAPAAAGSRASVAYGAAPSMVTITKEVYEYLNANIYITSSKEEKVI